MSEQLISFNYEKKSLPKKHLILSAILLAIGTIPVVFSFYVDKTRALFNSIIYFMTLAGIGATSIFIIAIEYLVGAVWSVVFRRIAEIFTLLIFVSIIFALPVLFNLNDVYHWTHLEDVMKDEVLKNKMPYLNEHFFIVRFIIYIIIWSFFLVLFLRNSLKQDFSGDVKLSKFNTKLSAIFLPFFAITITFVAIDWTMSLEPHWFSTIYGIYFFAGSFVCALALITFSSITLTEAGYLPASIKEDHFYNLGALLFGFLNFWAYIAFSQFLLIWYANLPEETFWYMMRWDGDWKYASLAMPIINFIVPYAALVAQPAKSNPKRLKAISLWIIFSRVFDIWWLTMPTYAKGFLPIGWIEISFLIFAFSLLILTFILFANRINLIPIKDPKIESSLKFKL